MSTWNTLAEVQRATRCEFTTLLARQHHFLRLPTGQWMRTLGPPGGNERLVVWNSHGRVWLSKYTAWGARWVMN